MLTMLKYTDIPKFPYSNYAVNIPITHIERWLASQGNELDLQLDPPFQRGHKWSMFQRTKYMEYLLKEGKASRVIKWNCPSWHSYGKGDNVLQLVDGKQRLKTVRMYLQDKVPVFGGNVCSDYQKLPISYDLIFEVYCLRTQKEVVNFYLSLNTGGSIHTEEDLTPAYEYLKEVS